MLDFIIEPSLVGEAQRVLDRHLGKVHVPHHRMRAVPVHDGRPLDVAEDVDRAVDTVLGKFGKLDILVNAMVREVTLDKKGRASGVAYVDKTTGEPRHATARAVVLGASSCETVRILLNSKSAQFPEGLANSSGYVGKHLMFNGNTAVMGLFEQPLNEYKSVQVTRIMHDFYDSDPKRGFYGGGGIDGRFQQYPIVFGLGGLPDDAPSWGSEYKRMLAEYFNRTMMCAGHTTSLPVETNSVTLDPGRKDDWGLPAMRITYRDHDDDLKIMQFMIDKGREILDAAGARRTWGQEKAQVTRGTAHLLGTCRMGNDPKTSVINPDHRTHDVPNLFLCDGSSMVTSGRGQPTMTIMALAFRAGERIAELDRGDRVGHERVRRDEGVGGLIVVRGVRPQPARARERHLLERRARAARHRRDRDVLREEVAAAARVAQAEQARLGVHREPAFDRGNAGLGGHRGILSRDGTAK